MGVTNFSFLDAAKYAEQDARFTWLLWTEAERQLRKNPVLWELFEFEMEVAQSLRPQEIHGVKVDTAKMERAARRCPRPRLVRHPRRADRRVRGAADFNPNATAQKVSAALRQARRHDEDVHRQDATQISVAEGALERGRRGGWSGRRRRAAMLDTPSSAKMIGTYFVGLKAKLPRGLPLPELQPTPGGDRSAVVLQAEPPQHPAGVRDPRHVRTRRRGGDDLRRLRPDRAAVHLHVRRGGDDARPVPRRHRHPHRHRCVGHRAYRSR